MDALDDGIVQLGIAEGHVLQLNGAVQLLFDAVGLLGFLQEVLRDFYSDDDFVLTMDMSIDELELDSLDITELCFSIEDEFDIEGADEEQVEEDIFKMETVEDAVNYILNLVN